MGFFYARRTRPLSLPSPSHTHTPANLICNSRQMRRPRFFPFALALALCIVKGSGGVERIFFCPLERRDAVIERRARSFQRRRRR